jgi:hypothetical protein
VAHNVKKKTLKVALVISALVAFVWGLSCYFDFRQSLWHKLKNPETVQKLKEFVALKKAQADADTNGVPPEIRAILTEAERGDWLAVSNSMDEIHRWEGWWRGWDNMWRSLGPKLAAKVWVRSHLVRHGGPGSLAPPDMWGVAGSAARDLANAFDVFGNIDEKFSERFGREIIASIPSGSIYLGGDDAGHYIPAVMLTPLDGTNSFYILPQWIFRTRDTGELGRLRAMYGRQIHMPTDNDMEECFRDYRDQVISGTNANQDAASIMGMTGLAIQRLMAANPQREFYLSQEYPIRILLPQYEPHGLVLKLYPQPVGKFADETLQNDRDFWVQEVQPLIGDWLTEETSVADIAAFVKKTFVRDNLVGFTGDAAFIHNEGAQILFAHARCNIANVYAWHAEKTTDDAERNRMARAADFAFRQAWALCPGSQEVIYSYVSFLMGRNRYVEALQVAETAVTFSQYQDDYNMTNLPAEVHEAWTNHLSKPAN